MDKVQILKYKDIYIDNIQIYENDIKYNNENFLVQSPIFKKYDIVNNNSNKYIELIYENKVSHLKFLSFIYSLEHKISNKFNKKINTQIITNIQNNKSLKIKISDNTLYYDNNKNEVEKLYSNKISLLFKININYYNYSLNTVQILQLT